MPTCSCRQGTQMTGCEMEDLGGCFATAALLNSAIAIVRVPGGFAAMARGAEPAKCLSMCLIAFEDPNAPDQDTLWRIFSMTKPIVGMATMLLIEEGMLRLDQPIADFLPCFGNMQVLTDPVKSLDGRPAKTPITVRHLLTHTEIGRAHV